MEHQRLPGGDDVRDDAEGDEEEGFRQRAADLRPAGRVQVLEARRSHVRVDGLRLNNEFVFENKKLLGIRNFFVLEK